MAADSVDEGKLRQMTWADLNMVLAWRNHPEVRRYMYTNHEISIDEHQRWFESASSDPDRHLLLFEHGGLASGFINLHRIAPGGIADWSFHLAPEAPRGTGASLGRAALEFCFQAKSYHKLCGQVLAFNKRSLAFHINLGFSQEGVLRDQHFVDGLYHDVICFGMLAADWCKRTKRH